MQGDWAELIGPTRTEVHIQLHGDTIDDPAPWTQVLRERLETGGVRGLDIRSLGDQPMTGSITPIPNAAGDWDGGFLLVAATSDMALAAARCLNGLCIPSASGTTRVGLRLAHDMGDAPRARGAAVGKSGRGARRAGRPSAP